MILRWDLQSDAAYQISVRYPYPLRKYKLIESTTAKNWGSTKLEKPLIFGQTDFTIGFAVAEICNVLFDAFARNEKGE